MKLRKILQTSFIGFSFLLSSAAGADYLYSKENDFDKKIVKKINKDVNEYKKLEKLVKKRDSLLKIYNNINPPGFYEIKYKIKPSKDKIPTEIKELEFIANEYVIGIDKTKQKLIIYKKSENEWTIETEYNTSTGMNLGNKEKKGDHKTPEGLFFIKSIERSGHWLYENKLAYGPWFMRLSSNWGDIGIHGTNEPEELGKAVSHGCIRIASKNISEIKENYAKKGMYVLIDEEFEYQILNTIKYEPIVKDNMYFQNNWKYLEKEYVKLKKVDLNQNDFQKKHQNFQNYTH